MARVVELDWWQSQIRRAGCRSHAAACPPLSARCPTDRMLQTLWGGFCGVRLTCQLFYAGDTGYSRDFVRIRERLAERWQPTKAAASTSPSSPSAPYAPRWIHEGPARQRRRSPAHPHRPRRRSARSACTGAPSSSPTKRWTNPRVRLERLRPLAGLTAEQFGPARRRHLEAGAALAARGKLPSGCLQAALDPEPDTQAPMLKSACATTPPPARPPASSPARPTDGDPSGIATHQAGRRARSGTRTLWSLVVTAAADGGHQLVSARIGCTSPGAASRPI